MLTVVTDRGRVRDHNEDAIGIDGWVLYGEAAGVLELRLDASRPSTIAVCDGMGGHLAGEFASRMAAELLTTDLGLASSERASRDADTVRPLLAQRVQDVADDINAIGDTHEEMKGMGTTTAGVVVLGDGGLLAFNVGDSTVLRCADGRPTLLSVADVGFGGGLTQALGAIHVPLSVHTSVVDPVPGSAVVLCSDGLTDLVSAEVVAKALDDGRPDRDVARELVDLACELGGHDNITVAIVRFAE
ncbi:hypothetical protein Rrhod_1843 [Rhodococcus rhodnii LMG 5362]|uniref:PPM-type phosphatase domain-containing protein n=1 Tax=Rhodococcus rhodnii LMG 5362 TaxID=1273125 RepID=R7WRZ6_9NOCA|nr:hypothetical protein Rrhod_1843 [Rhodococcus rhodnii LMG 5362]